VVEVYSRTTAITSVGVDKYNVVALLAMKFVRVERGFKRLISAELLDEDTSKNG